MSNQQAREILIATRRKCGFSAGVARNLPANIPTSMALSAIEVAFATPSPTAALREALLLARSWLNHSARCSIHTPTPTDDGFVEHCSCDYPAKVKVIDAALASGDNQ